MVYVLIGLLTFGVLMLLQFYYMSAHGTKLRPELIIFDIFVTVAIVAAVYTGFKDNGSASCRDQPNYYFGSTCK